MFLRRLVILSLVFISRVAAAEERESVLLPPPAAAVLALYDRPFADLGERERRRIQVFGLRLAPLHPAVWGTLARERTYNRNLVPIKRFFLRESEAPGFEARRIAAKFRFKAVEPRYMERMPHQKDPVFEIGFGGTFREKGIAAKPLADRSLALRLSAFPRLPSGIFERDMERFTRVAASEIPQLRVATSYLVEITFSGDEAVARLDGRPIARHNAPGLSRGLVSLQTSWHPISLTELSVEGVNGDGRKIELSGLAGERQ